MKNKLYTLGEKLGNHFDFQKEEKFLSSLETMDNNDKILFINENLKKFNLGWPVELIITEQNKEKIIGCIISGFKSVVKEL